MNDNNNDNDENIKLNIKFPNDNILYLKIKGDIINNTTDEIMATIKDISIIKERYASYAMFIPPFFRSL